MNILRKILTRLRKNNSRSRQVYSGKNVFDYILDVLPSDRKPLNKPIFLIGCARSGTTVTFSLLQRHPQIACLYEANKLWMTFFKERRDTDEHGDLLYLSDATPHVQEYLSSEFNKYRQREGRRLFAEKDPRNSIRLDFVYKVFPDAKYIVLLRNPYSTIRSLMIRHEEARRLLNDHKKEFQWWRSGDGWAEQRIPGWKILRNKPTFDAALEQFSFTMRKLFEDIKKIPPDQKMIMKYEFLLAQPRQFQKSLYDFIEVPYMSETRSALKRIYQPKNDFLNIFSTENIDSINQKCFDYFLKADYEMTLTS